MPRLKTTRLFIFSVDSETCTSCKAALAGEAMEQIILNSGVKDAEKLAEKFRGIYG